MPSARWSSPTDSSQLTSWQIGSAGSSTVHITSTWPLPKMLPDRAQVLSQAPVQLTEQRFRKREAVSRGQLAHQLPAPLPRRRVGPVELLRLQRGSTRPVPFVGGHRDIFLGPTRGARPV